MCKKSHSNVHLHMYSSPTYVYTLCKTGAGSQDSICFILGKCCCWLIAVKHKLKLNRIQWVSRLGEETDFIYVLHMHTPCSNQY